MSVTFIGIWFFSITDKSKEANQVKSKFDAQFFRSQTGIGIDEAVKH